jgi:glycosyltransferase involved in cell wall biosynthesis
MSLAAPRNVVHLDLDDGVPALGADGRAGGRGAYVVFWSGRVPLGIADLPPERLPMTAPQLADEAAKAVLPALWRYLFAPDAEATVPPADPDLADLLACTNPFEALRTALALPPDAAADLSVVVCTRDRPEALARCLDSLQTQAHPPLEVVVVDNASEGDGTRRAAEARPGVRYVREPRPGLDVARNTGVRHSRGALVAFTDDDVLVHPDWTARLAAAFVDPEVSAACGLVLPAELETEAQVLFETEWSLGQSCTPRRFGPRFFASTRWRGAPVWEIGAGANMAFRRAVFDAVGGFDERLDVGAAGCSGDSEFWYRILAADGVIRYLPSAVVHHYHRGDLEGLRRQIRQYVRGHAAALLFQFEAHRHAGNLRRLLLTLPRHYARLARRRLLYGDDPTTFALREEVAGFLSGIRFYLAHRRRPAYGP